jgi:hypothetical protein
MRCLFFTWICVLISLSMPSCIDDDVNTVLPEDDAELLDAYIQLNITLPNSTSTRADDADNAGAGTSTSASTTTNLDQDPTVEGTADEQTIHKVHLYLFTNGNPYSGNPIQIDVLKSTTAGSESSGYQSEVVKVKNQTYNAYLLVNYTETYSSDLTEEKFQEATASFSAVKSPSDITGTGIPMSARTNDDGPCKTVTLTAENTQINPARLSFTVERSWAKVTFTNTSLTHNVYLTTDETGDTDPLGTIEFLGYRFINIPATGYLFRHVGLLETPSALQSGFGTYYTSYTTDNGNTTEKNVYVCDPYSTQKVYTSGSDLTYPSGAYRPEYLATNTTTNSTFTPLKEATATENTILGYIPENVMAYDQQKKGYATGLLFKAQLKPKTVYDLVSTTVTETVTNEETGKTTEVKTTTTAVESTTYTPGDSLYFYQPAKRFYATMAALIKDNKLTDITEEIQQSAERRNKFGIYYYAGGLCYYPYYLRLYTPEKRIGGHLMQAMEFAIVRNNEYRLGISRIALRAAEDISIDPTEDVLLNEVYLTATVTVAPWVLRQDKDMTLGGF